MARRPATAPELKPYQKAFADQWIADGRGSPMATYRKMHPKVTENTAKTSAYKILHAPAVVAYLAQFEAKVESKLLMKSVMDEDFFLSRLNTIIEAGLQPIPITRGRKVIAMGLLDAKNAKSAMELAAKMRGLLIDRNENGKPGDFANKTREELEQSIKQRAAKLGIVVQLPGTKKAG